MLRASFALLSSLGFHRQRLSKAVELEPIWILDCEIAGIETSGNASGTRVRKQRRLAVECQTVECPPCGVTQAVRRGTTNAVLAKAANDDRHMTSRRDRLIAARLIAARLCDRRFAGRLCDRLIAGRFCDRRSIARRDRLIAAHFVARL